MQTSLKIVVENFIIKYLVDSEKLHFLSYAFTRIMYMFSQF